MFYKLKGGSHTQDGRKYKNGDIIESDIDLTVTFRGKFTEVFDDSVKDTGKQVEVAKAPKIALSVDEDADKTNSKSADDVIDDEDEDVIIDDEDEDEDEDVIIDDEDEDEDEEPEPEPVKKKAKKKAKKKSKKSKKKAKKNKKGK
jgi:hypothetical protein